jgi:hypothetical protein
MNRNSAQQDESVFYTTDSAQSRVSMKKKEETTCPRWKRTKRQKEILKLLFEAGECNPDRTCTKLLNFHFEKSTLSCLSILCVCSPS